MRHKATPWIVLGLIAGYTAVVACKLCPWPIAGAILLLGFWGVMLIDRQAK